MEWKATCPKKPGFYWAITNTDSITILKRSSKTSAWAFGGDIVDPKTVKLWGDIIQFFDDNWTKTMPNEDGWYQVKYESKKTGVVRLTFGDYPHCYDFEIPSEIDIQIIKFWDGPIKIPNK